MQRGTKENSSSVCDRIHLVPEVLGALFGIMKTLTGFEILELP
jgi:hypothetical protein